MSDNPTPNILNRHGEILNAMVPEVVEAVNSLPPLEWVNDNVKEDGTPRPPMRFRMMFGGEKTP